MAEQVRTQKPELERKDAEKLAEQDAAVQAAGSTSRQELLDATDELMAEIDGILNIESEHLVHFVQLGGE